MPRHHHLSPALVLRFRIFPRHPWRTHQHTVIRSRQRVIRPTVSRPPMATRNLTAAFTRRQRTIYTQEANTVFGQPMAGDQIYSFISISLTLGPTRLYFHVLKDFVLTRCQVVSVRNSTPQYSRSIPWCISRWLLCLGRVMKCWKGNRMCLSPSKKSFYKNNFVRK